MILVRVACAEGDVDRLVAELGALGAEGFLETGYQGPVGSPDCGAPGLDVYFSADAFRALPGDWADRLSQWGGTRYELPVEIGDRNWNAEWEATIEPVDVAPFYVHASWHDGHIPDGAIELIIDPKMSFGTGYHETTRLMLRAVAQMVSPGDRVLDAGTGTGILGIAALKVGAAGCLAFDNDPWCVVNAAENAELNGVQDVFSIVEGDERAVPDEAYDVILANINREALLAMMPALMAKLRPGGIIGLSGLLVSDAERVRSALPSDAIHEDTEGEWWTIWIRNETRDN